MEKNNEIRNKIIREICITECNYLNGLQSLLYNYMKPISNLVLLEPYSIRIIFGNLQELIQISVALLDDLKNETDKIDEIFLNFSNLFINAYSSYASNYSDALECLYNVKKNIRVFKFITERPNKSSNIKSLNDLLITPIQRIPRYGLLFKELKKYTNIEDKTYSNIEKIIYIIDSISHKINSSVEKYESKKQIWKIQNSFIPVQNFMAPHRIFVAKNDMIKLNRKGKRTEYTFFLFSGLLVYGKKAGRLKRSLSDLTINKRKEVSKEKYIFKRSLKIIRAISWSEKCLEVSGLEKSIIIETKNDDEKKKWIDMINNSIIHINDLAAPVKDNFSYKK